MVTSVVKNNYWISVSTVNHFTPMKVELSNGYIPTAPGLIGGWTCYRMRWFPSGKNQSPCKSTSESQ